MNNTNCIKPDITFYYDELKDISRTLSENDICKQIIFFNVMYGDYSCNIPIGDYQALCIIDTLDNVNGYITFTFNNKSTITHNVILNIPQFVECKYDIICGTGDYLSKKGIISYLRKPKDTVVEIKIYFEK